MYKICFLSSMHKSNDKRVYFKEALSLARAGFEVIHICPQSGKFEEPPKNTKEVLTINYPASVGLAGRLRQLYLLYKMALAVDANAYHCNEVDTWLVGVALKILNCKVCVFDVHEHYPSTFADLHFSKFFRPVVSLILRLLFLILSPFTDKVVLAKRSVSSDFFVSDKDKILVQNYTSLSGIVFSDGITEHNAKNSYTIVHLGLLSRIRGWPQILDAISMTKNRNLHLKCIGEFNDGSYFDFLDRVNILGLNERVEVLDWLNFDDAFEHLVRADIGIIAFQPGILNHIYAMPHKMFDYMAAGLAVMIPNFAVEITPIVLESKCGCLFDSGSPENLAKILDELMNNPVELRNMGMRGRKAVQERYNWESEAENLISMYKELEGM